MKSICKSQWSVTGNNVAIKRMQELLLKSQVLLFFFPLLSYIIKASFTNTHVMGLEFRGTNVFFGVALVPMSILQF